VGRGEVVAEGYIEPGEVAEAYIEPREVAEAYI